MRLFVGVELSDDLRDRASRVAARLRRDAERAAPEAAVRWVDAGNLHITVWFFGEVREPRDQALSAALERPLDAPPFSLRVSGAGAFPPSGAPRAVWLGLAAGREGLFAVHDALRDRLAPIGYQPEGRAYSPHLTIARVKDVGKEDGATLRRILREATDDVGGCEVRHATLFRSRTSPSGSRYEVLKRIELEASA
jgi:2'-5' RNA ligase